MVAVQAPFHFPPCAFANPVRTGRFAQLLLRPLPEACRRPVNPRRSTVCDVAVYEGGPLLQAAFLAGACAGSLGTALFLAVVAERKPESPEAKPDQANHSSHSNDEYLRSYFGDRPLPTPEVEDFFLDSYSPDLIERLETKIAQLEGPDNFGDLDEKESQIFDSYKRQDGQYEIDDLINYYIDRLQRKSLYTWSEAD